jgi:hypothetical protein
MAARERIEKRSHVGLSVPDEPPDADKADASSGNAILLQRASGTAGYLLYVAITEQWIEHRQPPSANAPQKVATRRCPK